MTVRRGPLWLCRAGFRPVEACICALHPRFERGTSGGWSRRNSRAQLVPLLLPLLAPMDVGRVMACAHDGFLEQSLSLVRTRAVHKRTSTDYSSLVAMWLSRTRGWIVESDRRIDVNHDRSPHDPIGPGVAGGAAAGAARPGSGAARRFNARTRSARHQTGRFLKRLARRTGRLPQLADPGSRVKLCFLLKVYARRIEWP